MSAIVPSLAERLRAPARRLAAAVVTPLLPDDVLDLVSPLANRSTLRGRVVAVEPETADSATVRIRPGSGWRPHRPGQYVRLGLDIDGVRLWRAYSLTSALGDPATISVTVKAIPDGVVSHHIVRRLRPGTLVHLDQATGDFTLPAPLPAKLLFITAGSGVTPVMGMLRNHLSELPDVVHVHASPRADAAIFGPELRALGAAGRLRLVENHDDRDGFLTPERLAALVPDLAERETWACGPLALLEAIETLWTDRGISERLHTERFRPALQAIGSGGRVSFDAQGVVTDADGATPLLDAGEAAGVLMPSGCRMGVCFGCVVPLTSGAVRDLRDGTITTASAGDDVQIQTCISAAAGACHIDL